MTWKCWVLLGTIAVIIILGLIIGRLREQKWLLQDQQRVAEIEEYRMAADEARKSAAASMARAEGLKADLRTMEETIVPIRTVYRKRKKPEVQTECDAYVVALEQVVEKEGELIMQLDAAYWDSKTRGDQLEQAWLKERDRANGFQKQAKRDKVKKVFIGVGSGVAGTLIGLGIGVAVD